MAQENLEPQINGWAENLTALGESLWKLSFDELKQVVDSLPDEQKKRIFVILNAEKSLSDTMNTNKPRCVFNEEAVEEE